MTSIYIVPEKITDAAEIKVRF